MKKHIFRLGFRTVFLVLCAMGILGHLSIDNAVQNINALAFFTILSNMLCFFIVFYEARKDFRYITKGKECRYTNLYYQMKGVGMLVITITCMTYNYILSPLGFYMVEEYDIIADMGKTDRDIIVHVIVPVMIWLDYILFQIKGKFCKWDPLKWVCAPILYFIFIMIRAKQVTSTYSSRGVVRYPYFFLDIDTYGIGYVISYVAFFALLSLVVGYTIRTIDFLSKMIYTKVIYYANSSINEKVSRGRK